MVTRRVALVTGAARRVGRTIALDLARHGFDVAVHCHQIDGDAQATVDDVRALGVRTELLAADLADEAACRALVPAVVERLGQLDAVVNNASVFEHDDAASFQHATMERHWRANTAAPILLAQALHAHAQARGARGCVVNLLDQKLWNPNPDHLSYTLSKAALESATTMLAMALAPCLRVAGVAPGVTLPSGPMSEAEFQRAHRMTPLERSSTPEDVAHAVRFVLESPAITGTTILVDGGQHLAAQPRDVMFLAS
ncbi:SDR family oxidoreductase [Aquincola sp. MAHUQ-54]|uniref:SDR family oxidoreductase n=1 Tax=Aquincola agrisoli TaxID=3119538 RepID=A0AAW9QEI0_9BURK